MKVCKDHHAELASRLVQIFLETDNIIDKLILCNQVILERESEYYWALYRIFLNVGYTFGKHCNCLKHIL